MKNLFKRCETTNYISNIAIAVQITKETSPPLFSLIRSGAVALKTCRFNCEVWKQLNYRRYKNAILKQ